jgi:phage terminase large subunit
MSADYLKKAKKVLEKWKRDPVSMVVDEFLAPGETLDNFQVETLRASAAEDVSRIALKACKGPGKTATMAWIGLNFLATRHQPNIGCTSITKDNLEANLWKEFSKWMHRSEFFRLAFQHTSTKIFARHDPVNWWIRAYAWPKKADPEQQADSIAGLHSNHVMWLADESGGYPQAVMVAMEAIFLTAHQEAKIVQSGNPTHVTGPLHRACTQDRHLWYVVTITGDPKDPKRSKRIDIKAAQTAIDQFGRDNPWVMVNILGQFPPASINALLSLEEVEAAMKRHLRPDEYDYAEKRIGVDVARFGDDRTVIFPRQGLAAFRPVIMRQQRTTLIAGRVARGFNRWGAEMISIDDSGHWGHGVVDGLITAGYPVIPVMFGDPGIDRRYKDRRTEMWLEGAKAIQNGAALPYIPEMIRELTVPTYSFIGNKFVLEPKDLIKIRLGSSPDLADAYFLTFALPDRPAGAIAMQRGKRQTTLHDFDPYALEVDEPEQIGPGRAAIDFDPHNYGGSVL